jgi:Gram-negative bacterial TonB protein C-terminal
MKLNLRTASLAGLLALTAAAAVPAVPPGRAIFLPPDVKSASDIPFPVTSMAAGVVSLLLTLDGSGQIQTTQVLRDFPSLTNVVQTAVQGWRFSPASHGAKHVPANLSVSAVFNPYNPGGASFQTLSLAPPAFTPVPAPGGPAYIPAQIVSASFAQYPVNSVAWGTVVLDVSINSAGLATNVHAIRKVASLTAPSINAVQMWSFNPASLDGQPVASTLVVAFVFPRNAGQP